MFGTYVQVPSWLSVSEPFVALRSEIDSTSSSASEKPTSNVSASSVMLKFSEQDVRDAFVPLRMGRSLTATT